MLATAKAALLLLIAAVAADLRRAVDLDPGNPSYFADLARVMRQAGDLDGARSMARYGR